MFIEGPLFGLRAARSIYKPPDDAVQRVTARPALNRDGSPCCLSNPRAGGAVPRWVNDADARLPAVARCGDLAVRYSHTGGGLTIGVNGYLNTNFRSMLDYLKIGANRLNSSSEVSKEIA